VGVLERATALAALSGARPMPSMTMVTTGPLASSSPSGMPGSFLSVDILKFSLDNEIVIIHYIIPHNYDLSVNKEKKLKFFLKISCQLSLGLTSWSKGFIMLLYENVRGDRMKISDFIYRYPTDGWIYAYGICRVRVFVNFDERKVYAVLTALKENRGTSVTNMIEDIADMLIGARKIPVESILIEHEASGIWNRQDRFDLVSIDAEGVHPGRRYR